MTLNLVRRSTKGSPLTAVDHDGNLDKLEQAIEGIDPADFATAAQGAKADTAVQPGSLATVATSGSYADLGSKPTIPNLSDATPQAPGTAAAGTVNSAARADHVHPLPAVVSASAAGLVPAFTSATGKVFTDGGWATPSAGSPGGDNTQLQFNNNGVFGGVSTLTTDGSGNLTFTGQWISSRNGAANTPALSLTGTWFTGGTSTTTKPQFLIEPAGTTSTAWSTSGTGLGVNAPSGFAGNLLDLQVNGASYFRTSVGASSVGTAILGTTTNYLALIGDSQGRGIYANSATANTPAGIYLWSVGQEINLITNNATRASITNASLALADGINLAVGTNNGTRIGAATTQKLGFWNAAPTAQPAAVADATDASTVITQLNALLSRLRTIGLIAT